MKIRELFAKPINRPINGVIKADQRDDESVWQELDEYVTTKQVTEYLRRFFDAYLATVDHPTDPAIVARMGVWVSGFFGSGKSHFIKILSYLLSNLEAANPASGERRRAAQFFDSKIKDPMLIGDIRRAVSGKTDVILFNIDSKADSKDDRDAILQVFLRVFNEMRGLSGDAPHVAEMERHLISKGSYESFKQAFKESNGNAWEADLARGSGVQQRFLGAIMSDEIQAASAASGDASLDKLLNERFAGRVVRKDLTKLIKEGANVPVYVLEYVREFEKLLVGGIWCIVTLQYRFEENQKTSPFLVSELKPIQMPGMDMEELFEARKLSMRQTHTPGERLFLDYAGQTVSITDQHSGEVRQAQIFVAVLGASNYTFLEATWSQQLSDWIGSHVRAMNFYGGTTELWVPDNLRSGVTKASRYEPDINPTYQDLASHYEVAVLPARARKPKDKAKVENGVLVVERWVLARLRHQRFFSINELNRVLRELLTDLNARPFKKLPGCRASAFAEMDQPALRALPEKPYEYAEWKLARVGIDYHVEVGGHYYSVPCKYARQQVDVRTTATTVEVFHRGTRLASHLHCTFKV